MTRGPNGDAIAPMTKRFLFHSFIVVIFTAFFAQAETKLPSILGSHMVLQQGEKCPIWGWDETGTEVTVTFAGQTHATKAGKDGRWQVNLTAMKVNSKGAALTVKGSSTVKLATTLDVQGCQPPDFTSFCGVALGT